MVDFLMYTIVLAFDYARLELASHVDIISCFLSLLKKIFKIWGDKMERDIQDALEILGRGKGFALDIGTGRGRMASGLAEYGYDVVSLDESLEALKRAREFIRESGVEEKVLLMVGDGHSLPFLDETFDVVATYNALHHMRDYKRVLDEMVRVCKKGGKIVISELNEYGKKVVEESHRKRGSHHEANISIVDVSSYLEKEYRIVGEIKPSERTDIYIATNISF